MRFPCYASRRLRCLACFTRDGIAERERALHEIADIAETTVLRYQQQVASGQLTPEGGKREALAALRAMRFGKGGYVVFIDPGMHAVMNPSKPETEGKFLGDYTDAKGAYVYRQMTAVANDSGGGFVDYYTHRRGETAQVRKRSFVERSSPAGCHPKLRSLLSDVAGCHRRHRHRDGTDCACIRRSCCWPACRAVRRPSSTVAELLHLRSGWEVCR